MLRDNACNIYTPKELSQLCHYTGLEKRGCCCSSMSKNHFKKENVGTCGTAKSHTSTKLVCLASLTVTTACTSSINFCFSSSSNCMYHLASRVFPARFWMRIKRICKKQDKKKKINEAFFTCPEQVSSLILTEL